MSDARQQWEERSKAWAARSAPGRSPDDTFNQMVLEHSGIQPGEDVLDLGSGTGNPAVTIALGMEGSGSVTCTDLTPRMLEAARTRARNLGLAIMRFVVADMTVLPFPDATFDCTTCRFAVMIPDDKVAAASEALRVLKPGGRAVYVVWGPYEENPPFWVPRRTVAQFLGEDEGPAPGRHAMSAPGTLKGILDGVGFERTEERELRYRRPVDDLGEYVESGLRRSFAKKVEGMAEDRFEALKQAVMDAWAPFAEDGTVRVPNFARLGIGWKPA